MKHMLLLCCFIMISILTHAQVIKTVASKNAKVSVMAEPANVNVSKNIFAEKTKNYERLVSKKEMAAANAVWNELDKMMMAEFDIVGEQIKATTGKEQEEYKTYLTGLLVKQQKLYQQIMERKKTKVDVDIKQLYEFDMMML